MMAVCGVAMPTDAGRGTVACIGTFACAVKHLSPCGRGPSIKRQHRWLALD
jgi:hypothetical protein